MTEENHDDITTPRRPNLPAEPSEEQRAVIRRSRRYVFMLLYSMVLLAFLGAGVLLGLYLAYGIDLPEVEALEDYQPSLLTEIYSDDGRPFGQFYLERRKLVSPDEIPKYFKQAVIAMEDKSFYSHFGIDVRRIINSIFINLYHWKIVRGASTITQQLSKLLFLTPEQSYERKFKEAILAIQIERHYSKERIFTFYANKVNMAHGNYGIAAAAEYYFDKPAKALSLSECALLAAIIKRPGTYSPIKNPKKSLDRRNLVLGEMYKEGYITEREMLAAQKEPLRIVAKDFDKNFAGYFLEYVRQYLQRRYSNKQIFTEGLKVYTTLNYNLQETAERSVQEGLRGYDQRKGWRGNLENVLDKGETDLNRYHHPDWDQPLVPDAIRTGLVMESKPDSAIVRFGSHLATVLPEHVKWTHRKNIQNLLHRGDLALFRIGKILEGHKRLEVTLEQRPEVQGAFLSIDNKTGAVKAMVGGGEWEESKWNRATQAKRQTGSIFKPFVYTTAILSGMTPDDTVLDEPLTVVSDIGVEYTPENYTKDYKGQITLRQALAESINVPAVRLGTQIGIPNIIKTSRQFGITSQLPPYPSLCLGSAEVTLMEMVSAFSTFPNQGIRMEPYYIQRIEDLHNNILEEHKLVSHEVLPPGAARQMVALLRGVVEYGTSTKAKALNVQLGGKTGTTNDFTDSWFIGFTPSLTAGAWMGFDEKVTLGNEETGARNALPLWIAFMKNYLRGKPLEFFPPDTSPFPEGEDGQQKPPDWSKRKIIEEDLER